MASSLYQLGITGLRTAQRGLEVTGHNIANVSTPGYSRQRVVQTTNIAQYSGSGFIGKGSRIESIERLYDAFLVSQVRDIDSRLAQSKVGAQQMGRLSGLLGDEGTGLSPSLANFFAAVNDVSQNPGDTAARTSLLAAGNSLTGRARELDTELTRLRKDANHAIAVTVERVNQLVGRIVETNEQIAVQAHTGQPPNDLLDRRDQLLRDLGQLVRVTTYEAEDRTVGVVMGNGQPLVAGAVQYKLRTQPDSRLATDLIIGLDTAGGTVQLPADSIGGGELAAHFTFRDGALTRAQNDLGRVTHALVSAFNAQHRLGQDKYGGLGGDFFTIGVPLALADARNTSGAVASATIADATQLTGSDYLVQWDGANYTVRRLTDGVTQSFATLPQTVDGVQVAITGAPAAGDSFLVLPTRYAAQDLKVRIADPAAVAAAVPVRSSAALANLGTGRIGAPVVIGPTPDPNLQQPVTITFTSATTFDVSGPGTGNPTGVAFVPGGSISYNGWTVSIDGAPRPGDTFAVGSNVGGSGDGGNARRLAALQSGQIARGETLAGGYGALVAYVGQEAASARLSTEAGQRLLETAEDAQQSISGVNLDEEAANLLRYQHAYQAAAKFTQIAGSLFDELINRLG